MKISKPIMNKIKNRIGNVDEHIIHNITNKIVCSIVNNMYIINEFREYEKDVLKFKFKLTNIKKEDIVDEHELEWDVINKRFPVLLNKIIRKINAEYSKDIPKEELTILQIIDICNIKGHALSTITNRQITGYYDMKHYLVQGKLSCYRDISGTGFGLNSYDTIERSIKYLEKNHTMILECV